MSVEKLLGVMSRKPTPAFPFTSYHLLFRCKINGGNLLKSHESESVEWKNVESVDPWHLDHYEWLKQVMN